MKTTLKSIADVTKLLLELRSTSLGHVYKTEDGIEIPNTDVDGVIIIRDFQPEPKYADGYSDEELLQYGQKLRVRDIPSTKMLSELGWEVVLFGDKLNKYYTLESKEDIKETDILGYNKPFGSDVMFEDPVAKVNDLLIDLDSSYVCESVIASNHRPANQEILRLGVNEYYNEQKRRIMIGNRLTAHFINSIIGLKQYKDAKNKGKTELTDSKGNIKEDKALDLIINDINKVSNQIAEKICNSLIEKGDERGNVYLNLLNKKRKSSTEKLHILDMVTEKNFIPTELCRNYLEFCLVKRYIKAIHEENELGDIVDSEVSKFPIYYRYLEGIKGCGPLMSAVIISEFNIRIARHESNFISYAGLDVVNGKARGRTTTREEVYLTKTGTLGSKKSLGYNDFLRTKLLGVLGSCFIKQKAESCVYRKIYDDTKTRYQNNPKYAEAPKAHIHAIANRAMIKAFVRDLWMAWRRIEGLPLNGGTYAEAKLGISHLYDRPEVLDEDLRWS